MNASPLHPAQPARLPAGALAIPEPATLERVSSRETLDQALAVLQVNKERWAIMEVIDKAAILDEVQTDLLQLGTQWVNSNLRAKQVPAGGFAEAEEWAIYGGVLRLIRLLRQSLRGIHRDGHPRLPGKPTMLSNGQVAIPTFPTSRLEQMLFQGMHAETWLEPGVTLNDFFLSPGSLPPNRQPVGRVALVLGAGNMGAIQCADLLHKLFVEQQVVALKTNPVTAYLGLLLEQGFNALIKRGFLRILYGGAEVGAYLCAHPLIDTVHLTGSDKTFDAIVFGSGEAGQRRKLAHNPQLTKPITAELGGVNPVIIVPGTWSATEIRRAALMIATWLYSNAGFACLAPRLLIHHRQWPQRQAFLATLGQILAETPIRPAYYPGAHTRHAAFLAAHPEAQLYGRPETNYDTRDKGLSWTLIADVDSAQAHDVCFQSESFCALLSETALDARDTTDFLAKATDFANQTLWGTLAATLLTPDRVKADPQVSRAIQQAVAELRYGTVCINQYTGFVYALMNIPWGSFPGQQLWDIQSGVGFVNNPFLLRQSQKSIFSAPFQRIDPVTVHSRSVAAFCKQYADFQARPSLGKLLKLFWLAMRG